jgi:hypothetical protein
MVRARITTAAATTATEIQKMGARRTRCMMVVLVLRVGNPGGSPFHPSIRGPSEIGSRSGLPVCMGRYADHGNRCAPPMPAAGGLCLPRFPIQSSRGARSEARCVSAVRTKADTSADWHLRACVRLLGPYSCAFSRGIALGHAVVQHIQPSSLHYVDRIREVSPSTFGTAVPASPVATHVGVAEVDVPVDAVTVEVVVGRPLSRRQCTLPSNPTTPTTTRTRGRTGAYIALMVVWAHGAAGEPPRVS